MANAAKTPWHNREVHRLPYSDQRDQLRRQQRPDYHAEVVAGPFHPERATIRARRDERGEQRIPRRRADTTGYPRQRPQDPHLPHRGRQTDQLGISRETLRLWETGEREPEGETRDKYVELLGQWANATPQAAQEPAAHEPEPEVPQPVPLTGPQVWREARQQAFAAHRQR